MPKNKGKYHSKDPEQPVVANQELVTLTSRVLGTVRPHALKIVAVLGGVAVVLIAVSTWSWFERKRAMNATKGFTKATEVMKAEVTGPDAPPEPVSPPKKDAPPKFATAQERNEAALAAFDKVEKDYGKAKVAKSAALLKAGLLFDMGRYDEAAGAYQKFLKGAPAAGGSELQVVAREGLGYAQEAKALAQKDAAAQEAGLAEALKTFEALQPDEKGYYRDMALFHQARIHAAMKHKDKATELYKQALDSTRSQTLRKQINNRLAVLEEQS